MARHSTSTSSTPSTAPSTAPSSIASTLLRRATAPASPSLRNKPSINISLDNHYASKVHTTGSSISGTAVVRTSHDVPFDSVEIVLLGIARTRTDVVQFQRHAARVFLRMNMPLAAASYPVPRVFEAGVAYEFPFSFVVPAHLTISSCEHPVKADHVRAQHLNLPPTMGFWKAQGGGRDDMAPEMSQVEYLVKATVLAQPDLGAKPERLMAGVHPVRVLPVSHEAPPLDLSGPAEKVYTATKTKSIRKGLLSGKMGRLTASAQQPAAIFLSPDGRSASSSVAAINLSFTPSSSSSSTCTPPAIHSVAAKITATTCFGTAPMTEIPNMRVLGPNDFATSDVTVYSTSTALLTAGFEKEVPWKKAAPSRRDSGYESDELLSSGSGKKTTNIPSSDQHTTATLLIPFTLPTDKKLFLPTFHSCLVSRVYTLHLAISAGPTSTALNLALPLQIAVRGDSCTTTTMSTSTSTSTSSVGVEEEEEEEEEEGLPTFETALAEREADERLRPRVLRRAATADDDGGNERTVGSESCPRGMLPGYATATATATSPAVVA